MSFPINVALHWLNDNQGLVFSSQGDPQFCKLVHSEKAGIGAEVVLENRF